MRQTSMPAKVAVLAMSFVFAFHAWADTGAGARTASGTNRYALCVGVNTYKSTYLDPSFRLEGCVLDANLIWTNITKRGEWTAANATRLLNSGATKSAIRKAITNIAAKAVSGDVFFYYHSSHGGNDCDNYDVYLCSYDADYTDQELASDLAQFASGVKVVVMVDACYSGGLFKPVNTKSLRRGAAAPGGFDFAQRVSDGIDALRAGERRRRGGAAKISSSEIGWLTSADYNQDSWESASGGEFTQAAIQGWTNGVCDSAQYGNRDGYANFHELWNYAKDIAVGHAPPAEDRTDAQCLNTNVLRATIAGWVGPKAPGAAYAIQLDQRGGKGGTTSVTARCGAAMPTVKVPTKTGYTFGGYYSGVNGSGTRYYTESGASARTWNLSRNATLYAKWTARPYTVSFDGGGGTGTMAPQRMKYGTAAALRKNAFSRKGYVFAGWSKKKGGSVAFKNGEKVKNLSSSGGKVKLYAKWAKKNYGVAFKANGGRGTMAKQTMTYGKSAKLRKNAFKRKGYTFAGWAKTSSGAVAYKDTASVKNLRTDGKTANLYAKWKGIPYKVVFKGNGGTGTMAAQTMTYGSTAKLRTNAFTRTGYTFAGWAKTSSGAVAYKNAVSVKNLRSDGNTVNLYAKWQAISYKVAFKANGGTGTMATQTMTYGKSAQLGTNAFMRTGYTFAGWAKTTTGAVAFRDAAWVKNLRTDSGTTTLHAQWTPTIYRIVFDANGGEGEMAEQMVSYDETAQLPANAFICGDCPFLGWSRSPEGEVEYADQAEVKNLSASGETVTLYAQWQTGRARAKGVARKGAGVATTTSDGTDGSAVADGDEGTGWVPEGTEAGAWVILSFAEARDVAEVEVVGENLPEGMRVLLSEDAEAWWEGEGGAARYVWVAFPESAEGVVVREIRVVEAE